MGGPIHDFFLGKDDPYNNPFLIGLVSLHLTLYIIAMNFGISPTGAKQATRQFLDKYKSVPVPTKFEQVIDDFEQYLREYFS